MWGPYDDERKRGNPPPPKGTNHMTTPDTKTVRVYKVPTHIMEAHGGFMTTAQLKAFAVFSHQYDGAEAWAQIRKAEQAEYSRRARAAATTRWAG